MWTNTVVRIVYKTLADEDLNSDPQNPLKTMAEHIFNPSVPVL